jgi:hypothetical protein
VKVRTGFARWPSANMQRLTHLAGREPRSLPAALFRKTVDREIPLFPNFLQSWEALESFATEQQIPIPSASRLQNKAREKPSLTIQRICEYFLKNEEGA